MKQEKDTQNRKKIKRIQKLNDVKNLPFFFFSLLTEAYMQSFKRYELSLYIIIIIIRIQQVT